MTRRVFDTPSTLPDLVADMRDVGATHISSRRLSQALGSDTLAHISAADLKMAGLWSIDQLERFIKLAGP